MINPRTLWMLAIAGTLISGIVQADQADELLALINDFRSAPQSCNGNKTEAVTPLAPAAELARLPPGGARQLDKALREAGYVAARAEALTLSGPTDAPAALRFMAQGNCRLLLDPGYTVAGVSHSGRDWQIVVALPLLAPDLADWATAGRQILQLVNKARARPRNCGKQRMEAAAALRWNPGLGAAALAHSRDMARRGVLSHEGRDGNTAGARANAAGYLWRSIGENVATGQGSPAQAVEGWLASPGHCVNVMNRAFVEMGAAYAINRKSNTIIYWTQVFGAPR